MIRSAAYGILPFALVAVFASYLWARSEQKSLMVLRTFALNLVAAIPIYMLFVPSPIVRRSRLERSPPPEGSRPVLVPTEFEPSFPTNSASTSFVSRCTKFRLFARFGVGSLFFAELVCFFKVDLLIRFDCT